jgi:hypothetical protein
MLLMKNKFVGYLVSALFVAVVVAVIFRVQKLKNAVLGTAAS